MHPGTIAILICICLGQLIAIFFLLTISNRARVANKQLEMLLTYLIPERPVSWQDFLDRSKTPSAARREPG